MILLCASYIYIVLINYLKNAYFLTNPIIGAQIFLGALK